MDIKRKSQIDKRLTNIPRAYRATYRKAVEGKSLRAAINAKCLECVYYKINAIRFCSDLACQLYAVRPYQKISQNGHEDRFSSAESKNSGKGDIINVVPELVTRGKEETVR